MRISRIIYISVLSLLTFGSGCDIINPPEKPASYIQIDTFKFDVQDIDQGEATHNISNCYISLGGYNAGIFELPFTIPTLETGLQTITIRAGIKLNGITASRIDYPFFNPYIIDLELRAGETHKIEPVTTYKDVCKFSWMENFEDPGLSFEYSEYSDTTFIIQDETIRSGRYSGVIYVDEENKFFEAFSEYFVLPQNASPILLEFDYKNNNGFEVGMYNLEGTLAEWYSLIYINPNDNWKRIYIDIGQTATRQIQVDKFRMAIRVFHNADKGDLGEVYLDNIKLIHY